MFADVVLPLNLPNTLTYGVPVQMQDDIRPGMRVEVPLGKNKVHAGIVAALHNKRPEGYIVRPVKGIIDVEPVVTELQLKFWALIANYYMASPGEVMQAALPAHLKMASETRLEWICPPDAEPEWSDKCYPAASALKLRHEMTLTELREVTGARDFQAALMELLETEAVRINDTLESPYKPKRETVVTLADRYEDEALLSALFKELERAPRQMDVLLAFMEIQQRNGFVRRTDISDRLGGQAAQALKTMAAKGIFLLEERNTDRIVYEGVHEKKEVVLTPGQRAAFEALTEAMAQKNTVLLHGVTGSGKTLLYIDKIRECIADGGQALFMVPEIGLTTQLLRRLHAYFGDTLGVYHSHFTNNERVEIWEKVRTGAYQVVVGPRSAIWLPFNKLKLIVVDEEHDTSYKQRDPAPRFHARDAAMFLAALHGCNVVLGSATPSVETLQNVQLRKYGYVPLKERYLGVNLPEIRIVNAKTIEALRNEGVRMLTPDLKDHMEHALRNRKQVILFQNKRGYTPFQMCTSCGWVPQCPNCSVSLTYHKATDKLHCHYCGSRSAVIATCPACGHNRFSSKSFGTEKIEEEVQAVFPKARVARMDVDSMKGKNSMTELLNDMEKGKIDILVGTQMVVKGLDFSEVALVGILSADSLLSFPDFRVNERGFQLMEQVSGRSGRSDGKGLVLIQAYNMKHPVLEWVREHDVQKFYISEIKFREKFQYPPFSRLIKVSFKHVSEEVAIAAAQKMAELIHQIPEVVVQGPGPALVARIRNKYIQEIWLKCPRDNRILDRIKATLKEQRQMVQGTKNNSALTIAFDADPY
jgi:primosomal protein N' (replication factor Y) (superfamily II helicase)